MRCTIKSGVLPLVCALTLASQASAQRAVELGIDVGAIFGLGDESSVTFTLPASRFRAGFFLANPKWSLEPAAGFSYNKVEGEDGIFTYDLEIGALYHFRPFVVATADQKDVIARFNSVYARPFIGFTGFTGGDSDDSEVSIGGGLGIKVPWRGDLAWRLETNLGYGLDNEALRIGLLAGLSFFTR
jgi:hypothetical protein